MDKLNLKKRKPFYQSKLAIKEKDNIIMIQKNILLKNKEKKKKSSLLK